MAIDRATGVEVRASSIHAHGVFARRSFRAGEVVLRWDTSVQISASAAAALPEAERIYIHPLGDGGMFVVQLPERHVNHSCEHNTEVHAMCDVAVRDIAVGEEITSNYETDGAGQCFTCQCGTASCRGQIGHPR